MSQRRAPRRLRFTHPWIFAGLCALLLLYGLADLASGLLMMSQYGPEMEQNPIARLLFVNGGLVALSTLKLATLVLGIAIFWRVAFALRRPRIARAGLMASIILMILGFTSNMV